MLYTENVVIRPDLVQSTLAFINNDPSIKAKIAKGNLYGELHSAILDASINRLLVVNPDAAIIKIVAMKEVDNNLKVVFRFCDKFNGIHEEIYRQNPKEFIIRPRSIVVPKLNGINEVSVITFDLDTIRYVKGML